MTADNLGWLADHIEAISSDMSVYHRIDDVLEMDTGLLFARVRHLPAYGGALMKSNQVERPVELEAVEPSTRYPQPVEDPDNTPPEQVEAMRRRALLKRFPPEIAEGGINVITPEEMEREVMSGG